MKVYLIKQLWIDTTGNHSHSAYGHKDLGVVFSKDEAEKYCQSEFIQKSQFPWPLESAYEFKGDSVPRYISIELDVMDDPATLVVQ